MRKRTFYFSLTTVSSSLILLFAGMTGATADDYESSVNEGVGVEFVTTSSDSIKDVIERALESQTPSAVAAAVHSIAASVESSGTSGMPGLENPTDPHSSSSAIYQAADAIVSGAPLPSVLETINTDSHLDSGPVVSPAPTASENVAARGNLGGYAWQETDWLRRGVTTGGGNINWTDRVEVRWTTNPGSGSSRIDFNRRYFPSSGYFTKIQASVEVLSGNQTQGGMGIKSIPEKGSSGIAYNDAGSLRGKTMWHRLTLHGTGKDKEAIESSATRTGVATCQKTSSVCKY